MGHSSLLGIERADPEPAGRDAARLGPSDTSDSGSDVAGIQVPKHGLDEPVDAALARDPEQSLMANDMSNDSASDAGGTGERRSAGMDGGAREGADISVDRIVGPAGDEPDEYEDPDLEFIDQAVEEDALSDEPDEDLDENEPPGEATSLEISLPRQSSKRANGVAPAPRSAKPALKRRR